MGRPRVRDEPGKLIRLLDLITEHEQAFAYDWRTKFGQPLSVVFDGSMAWHESWDLTQQLLSDPTSAVHAAVADWAHPTTREALVAADLFDLTASIASGKRQPKPYPRPWDPQPKRMGDTGGRTREQIEAILASLHAPEATRDARGRLHGPDGRYVKG